MTRRRTWRARLAAGVGVVVPEVAVVVTATLFALAVAAIVGWLI